MAAEKLIAVVTGASRGAGKGIALALADTGATVFVTGRTEVDGSAPDGLPGSIHSTAAEIDARGGRGIALACDHRDDAQVEAAFDKIRGEAGRIDVLVNNAYTLPDRITARKPFWEKPGQESMIEVGLRSSYISSYFAAPLLLDGGKLAVNTSSFGGTCYMHGPAYGAVKAGVDKMAHDMSVDFAPFDVAVISLWMGMLRTERTEPLFAAIEANPSHPYADLTGHAESAQFPGRVIAALATHPDRMSFTGQVHVAAELAVTLGVTDLDGRTPPSHRPELGNPPSYSSAVIY